MLLFTAVTTILILIGILIGVAFFTLFERKLLGLVQMRKGPNKLSLLGITQPFSDALKLISKEIAWPITRNFNTYLVVPFAGLTISLLRWLVLPNLGDHIDFNLSGLFLIVCLSLRAYPLIFSGWASSSKYAYIGAIRAIAQSISYEVSLALIMLRFFTLTYTLNFKAFREYQSKAWFSVILLPLTLIWVIRIFAELNRTPFDFAEGESELVSGFNIEYRSLIFGAIFLREYASIIFMSLLTTILAFGGLNHNKSLIFVIIFLLLILWVRCRVPRFRYDYLIILAWKILLPIRIVIYIFISSII